MGATHRIARPAFLFQSPSRLYHPLFFSFSVFPTPFHAPLNSTLFHSPLPLPLPLSLLQTEGGFSSAEGAHLTHKVELITGFGAAAALDADEHPLLYLDLRVKPSHFPTSIEVAHM